MTELGLKLFSKRVAITLAAALPLLLACGKEPSQTQATVDPRGTSDNSDRKVSKLVLTKVNVLAGSGTAGSVDGIGTAAKLNRFGWSC